LLSTRGIEDQGASTNKKFWTGIKESGIKLSKARRQKTAIEKLD
jgi:hypothetical protein